MIHKYMYSARAHEVAARQLGRSSYINKTFFLLAMLAVVLFVADREAEAGLYSDDFHLASVESAVLASGVYVASHYRHNYYRRPHSYRHNYRPRSRYNYPRYRSRYYNRHYNKRYYNRHGYGHGYRYRRHY